MMKVLLFGFKNSSGRIISKLDNNFDKIFVTSNATSIMKFAKNTDFARYDYVVGFGNYSGPDNRFIRIETKCNSQFRNDKTNLEYISIPYFFKPNKDFKQAFNMGNSLCNYITYSIIKESPDLNFTFLHIPKTFDRVKAIESINKQLKAILA